MLKHYKAHIHIPLFSKLKKPTGWSACMFTKITDRIGWQGIVFPCPSSPNTTMNHENNTRDTKGKL